MACSVTKEAPFLGGALVQHCSRWSMLSFRAVRGLLCHCTSESANRSCSVVQPDFYGFRSQLGGRIRASRRCLQYFCLPPPSLAMNHRGWPANCRWGPPVPTTDLRLSRAESFGIARCTMGSSMELKPSWFRPSASSHLVCADTVSYRCRSLRTSLKCAPVRRR